MVIVNLKAKKFFIFVISLIIIHFSSGLKIKKDDTPLLINSFTQKIEDGYECASGDYSGDTSNLPDSCGLSKVKTLAMEPYTQVTITHKNGYKIEITNGYEKQWKVPLDTYLNLYQSITSIDSKKISWRSAVSQNIKISNVHIASKLGKHKVLDIKDKKTNKNGANVQLYDKKNQGNQRWNLTIYSSGYNLTYISNVEHGKHLAMSRGTPKNNMNIEINDSYDFSKYGFRLILYSEKYFYIAVNNNKNYVLDIYGNKDKNKQNIQLYQRKDSNNDNQLWYIEYS